MSEHPEQLTDEAIVTRFQGGDRATFAVLVRRYQGPLYNFALRNLRNPAAAEEVVQDAFMRVVQSANEFKPDSRFVPWVYTIARNLCVDSLRKRGHRQHRSLDEPSAANGEGIPLVERTADGRAGAERTVASTQIRVRLLAAIAELPDEQREVFLLREISNLPFKEIADVVGAPENTVKSRMRYALERLQTALSEFEEYARALR